MILVNSFFGGKMNKKNIFIGVIIIFLILSSLLIISINDKFNVGSTYLDLPKGYQVDSSSIAHTYEYSTVNITNGENVISIYKYNDGDLSSHIDSYTNVKNRENHTLIFSNITINNINVEKSVDKNNSHIVHYWFLYDDNVYDIGTWDYDSYFDENVHLMINSINE